MKNNPGNYLDRRKRTDMEKMKMHSPNLTQENIARIRELFPGCVTEVEDETTKGTKKIKLAVDFDQLRQELSESIIEGPQERYHLNWPGKREALLTANAPIAKTLRPCREESVDFDTTKNLFIEGDNLEALKLLQETYLGKVKMIYIDPPYNTGNDFIYEDDFAENAEEFLKRSNQKDEKGNRLVANTEANGRFHSDWLSMIYSRLKLAKNLLSDDGVIFISIDDNEVSNLRKICDEIFGSDNQINPIVHNKLNSKNDTINVQRNHEYIVCYRKTTQYLTNTKIAPSIKKREFVTEEVSCDGELYFLLKDPITTRGDGGTLNERKNLGYSVYFNQTTKDFIAVHDYDINLAQSSNDENLVYSSHKELLDRGYTPIRPPRVRGKLGAWTWDINKFNTCKDQISIYETRSGYSVRKRELVPTSQVFEDNGKYFIKYLRESNSRSIIEYSTNEGSTQLSDLLGQEGIFNNPKNVDLLEYIIGLIPANDFIFFDFFAGSAASIHALLRKNSADNGSRRFMAIQLPEPCSEESDAFRAGYKTIAEISKERIRRAGARLKSEMGKVKSEMKDKNSLFPDSEIHSSPFTLHNSLDIGFRVLKVDSSNMADIYYTPDAIEQGQLKIFTDNIKSDRKPEDLLFQVLLDWGVDLTLPIRKRIVKVKSEMGRVKSENEEEISPFTLHSSPFKEFEVYFVDENSLLACFDTGVNEDLVKELARLEPLRVVFRDTGFVSDAVKINVEQIFRQMSPGTEVKSI